MQNEKVVEIKQCKHCNSNFEITDKDLEFYDKISPVFKGQKYKIPTPTFCPDCRQQRRLSFRNQRKLYNRKCSASGRQIISVYSPDKNYKVYNQEFWWSDRWDPMEYGINFDFTKRFFEQFGKLSIEVPKVGLFVIANNNSEFLNFCGWNENSYLLSESDNNKDCLYGENSYWNKNCIDISYTKNSEKCYDCTDCYDNYSLYYSQGCHKCSNSKLLKNCIGCKSCFASTNLVNKEYYIFNEPYSRDEYYKKLSTILINDIFIEDFYNKNKDKPNKYLNGMQNENIIGDYLYNCNNAYFCFDGRNLQDCKFVSNCDRTRNTYDIDYFGGDGGTNMAYEGQCIGNNAYKVLFSNNLWENTDNIFYSDFCHNSSNLFGCIGLRNKQYCILNKQYTKEEYEILVPKIIEHMIKTGEWGEFFPSSISPFGYNETLAQEYFSLTKEKVLEKGFKWSDYEIQSPKVEKIVKAKMLPEKISDISDDILNWAIMPEVVNDGDRSLQKPFRILKQELKFYKENNLPIPTKHPEQRYLERIALRNPRKLFDRKCDKCGKNIKTTYSPEKKEIVYCEECYIG